MIEEWKDIVGYEGLYQVSNLGRIKSLGRYVNNNGGLEYREGKIMKSAKNNNDYLFIGLWKDGIRKNHTIHRLVAQAFIDNPNNFPEINHKDEDKTNNRVENLEWCNSKYNCNYGTHNERMVKSHLKPILQFSKDGEFIRRWESGTQVKRELGFNQSNITKCLKGKKKTCGGYVWGYEKDYKRIQFKVFDLVIYKKIA